MGSLPAAKLLDHFFERNSLCPLTLRDRLEKHSLRLRVGFERLVSFRKEHDHRCTFRKFRIGQLNATADDATRSNSHGFENTANSTPQLSTRVLNWRVATVSMARSTVGEERRSARV